MPGWFEDIKVRYPQTTRVHDHNLIRRPAVGSIGFPMPIRLPAFLESPFCPFCIPPALAVLQFLVMSWLMAIGFPDFVPDRRDQAGMLITVLLGLCFFALLGMGWSLRQVLYGKYKIAAALGAVFNGAYFLGFLLFFIAVFVTHASN
jgi:hypothetical protein